MKHTVILTLLASTSLLSLRCKDDVILPPSPHEEPQWGLPPQFASLDIHYMLQKNGALFLSAIDPAVVQTTVINNKTYYVGDRGLVFSTIDGINWKKLKGFRDDVGSSSDRKILFIGGASASPVSDAPIAWPLSGVWFVPCQHYYVVGSGIYEKGSLFDNAWLNDPLDITTYYTTKVRGNGTNDVFICGAYGELLHYNASTWKSYRSEVGLSSGAYGSVAIKNNLLIAVGYDSPRAVITIGRRY
jgi:hypothetical protein